MRKIVKAASFTLFIFGLLGWLYIVAISLVHPETLTTQLTHFAPWPREDTFGLDQTISKLTQEFITVNYVILLAEC
jgi:hypothetical protein